MLDDKGRLYLLILFALRAVLETAKFAITY